MLLNAVKAVYINENLTLVKKVLNFLTSIVPNVFIRIKLMAPRAG